MLGRGGGGDGGSCECGGGAMGGELSFQGRGILCGGKWGGEASWGKETHYKHLEHGLEVIGS